MVPERYLISQMHLPENRQTFIRQRELSCSPSTPGVTDASTVCSIDSPQAAEEPLDPNAPSLRIPSLEDLIKVKKSDCILDLFEAWQRTQQTQS
jgi:hypothetical protein